MPHRETRCRKCGSADVRRSSEHGILDLVMRAILKKRAYRCRSCRGRFFASFDLLAPDSPVAETEPRTQQSGLEH